MKLLARVRMVLRKKHYSYRTEKTYVHWIKRYIYFNKMRHPRDLSEKDIARFISHLAINRNVAASTQNQALNAVVFLYKRVLNIELGAFGPMERAKRPKKLPVVLSKEEVEKVFDHLEGTLGLMAEMLYGCGLRLPGERPKYQNRSALTPSAIVLLPIYWKTAMTSGPFKNFSAIMMFRQP